MSVLRITTKGSTKKTSNFLNAMRNGDLYKGLGSLGSAGVNALASATPKDSGTTASSWYYEIEINQSSVSIIWKNDNVNKGVNIAIILQYGHGTGTGGYVAGIDYINPAIRPIFNEIANEVWKKVVSA